jgi:hypothetical protein
MGIIAWVLAHKFLIATVGLIVVRVGESVAIATKTDVDNKIVAAVKEFFTLDFFKAK